MDIAGVAIASLQVTHGFVKYLKDFKDAPKDLIKCREEATNLYGLLTDLNYHATNASSDDEWYTAVRSLFRIDGPMDQYKRNLQHFRSIVQKKSLSTRLTWNVRKADVELVLRQIEHVKTLVIIALERDHFKLSHAIKRNTDVLLDHATNTRDCLEDILESQQKQENAQTSTKVLALLDWLSPTDPIGQHHDILRRRTANTGQWLLVAANYEEWLQGTLPVLFCPGIPGAGKTIMAATVIDHLYEKCLRRSQSCAVAHYYCNYSKRGEQTIETLFASLLKQICHTRSELATSLLKEKFYEKKRRPTQQELGVLLKDACARFTTIYIVVDALDEFASSAGRREELVDRLLELQAASGARLLVTSRDYAEIADKFKTATSIEVRASRPDVLRYINGRFNDMPECIRKSGLLRDLTRNRILRATDGMFLLARLHTDALCEAMRPRDVKRTLDTLGEGSRAVQQAYTDVVSRIDGQSEKPRELAWKALCWIVLAARPLTTQELCVAVSIEQGDNELDDDDVCDITDIVATCRGLITVDEEVDIVRLVHYTTHDFLKDAILERYPQAEIEIATTCLTYLSFGVFASVDCYSRKAIESKVSKIPLYLYAATYWAQHVSAVEHSAIVQALAIDFLCHKGYVSSFIAIQEAFDKTTYRWLWNTRANALHLLARHGLTTLAGVYLDADHLRRSQHSSSDSEGWTPLHWAAAAGQISMIELLISRGADVNSLDDYYRTPLIIAIEQEQIDTVTYLLELPAVDVNSGFQAGWGFKTPLHLALERWHGDEIQLLLSCPAVDVNAKDEDGNSPLMAAFRLGRGATQRGLITRTDVDVNEKDETGRPLLLCLADDGDYDVTLFNLRPELDLNATDAEGCTALCIASRNAHYRTVSSLLEFPGVNADTKDVHSRTPFSYAVQSSCLQSVVAFLQHPGIDINSRDSHGTTPLTHLIKNSHGPSQNKYEEDIIFSKFSAFFWRRSVLGQFVASGRGLATFPGYVPDLRQYREAMVDLVLGSPLINAGLKDDSGWTPLSLAAATGDAALVKLLVQSGKCNEDLRDEVTSGHLRAAIDMHPQLTSILWLHVTDALGLAALAFVDEL